MTEEEVLELASDLNDEIKDWYGERWGRDPKDSYWKGVNLGVNMTCSLLGRVLAKRTWKGENCG